MPHRAWHFKLTIDRFSSLAGDRLFVCLSQIVNLLDRPERYALLMRRVMNTIKPTVRVFYSPRAQSAQLGKINRIDALSSLEHFRFNRKSMDGPFTRNICFLLLRNPDDHEDFVNNMSTLTTFGSFHWQINTRKQTYTLPVQTCFAFGDVLLNKICVRCTFGCVAINNQRWTRQLRLSTHFPGTYSLITWLTPSWLGSGEWR